MPRIEIYYSIKVNPDPKIIEACLENKTNFDVGSLNEI